MELLRKQSRKQVLFLSLWSFLFLVPLLLTTGPNIVTKTYQESTERFWTGEDPYDPWVKGDVFQYSPFFAMAYAIFGFLPPLAHALLWALFNAFFFWWGMSSWFQFKKSQSLFLWATWAMACMELDISLRYQQINAFMVGITLLGLSSYRKGRDGLAGTLLALVTNIKMIPGLFGFTLLWPKRKNYLLGFLGISIFLVVLPLFIVGPERGIFFYQHQLLSLAEDIPHRKMYDIRAVLRRLGHPRMGQTLWWSVLPVSLSLFFGYHFSRAGHERKNYLWGPWITLGLSSVLLLSPRTESPTFVLVAPLYLFLASYRERWIRISLGISMFFTTFIYTSVWPREWHMEIQDFFTSKCFGVFILWGISTVLIARSLVARQVSKEAVLP